jgi:transcriptional regulator with XRE-family HTH domain
VKQQLLVSPATSEVLHLLGDTIRAARLRRGWTVQELAERVGVSHPTITRMERGHPGVAIGSVIEAAVVCGVPLYDPDPTARARHAAAMRIELALLPEAARRQRSIDDDF